GRRSPIAGAADAANLSAERVLRELLEPTQSLLPRHRRVRGRGRGQHEEARLADDAVLHAEGRPLAERAAVRLLADEADPRRTQLDGDPLEALRRVGEVRPAQVARSGGRPVGRVREADPLAQELELLVRLVEP